MTLNEAREYTTLANKIFGEKIGFVEPERGKFNLLGRIAEQHITKNELGQDVVNYKLYQINTDNIKVNPSTNTEEHVRIKNEQRENERRENERREQERREQELRENERREKERREQELREYERREYERRENERREQERREQLEINKHPFSSNTMKKNNQKRTENNQKKTYFW